MRGPFWGDGRVGVTGEPTGSEYAKTHPHVQHYTDEDGVLRTRILPREEVALPQSASLQ